MAITDAPTAALDRLADRLSPRTVAGATGLLGLELVALLAYYANPSITVTAPRYALYGLVWVNVGLVVLATLDVAPASPRTRRRALAVAVAYLGALAVAGGVVGLSAGPGGGLRIAWLPPGWGPALLYSGGGVAVVLMPARVIGYLALAALVYATVVDASGAGVAGVLGLLSCVSCSWPVLAGIASGLAGSSSALAAATAGLSYDLSTLVFVVTVALLYWRPVGR